MKELIVKRLSEAPASAAEVGQVLQRDLRRRVMFTSLLHEIIVPAKIAASSAMAVIRFVSCFFIVSTIVWLLYCGGLPRNSACPSIFRTVCLSLPPSTRRRGRTFRLLDIYQRGIWQIYCLKRKQHRLPATGCVLSTLRFW